MKTQLTFLDVEEEEEGHMPSHGYSLCAVIKCIRRVAPPNMGRPRR